MEHILRVDKGKDFVEKQETFAKKFKKLLFDPKLVEYFKQNKTKTIVSFLTDEESISKGFEICYNPFNPLDLKKVDIIIQKREAKLNERISNSLGFKQTLWFQVQIA